MKILVVIWTYHRSDFYLFSLIFTYFAYFFMFFVMRLALIIDESFFVIYFLKRVFCVKYIFFSSWWLLFFLGFILFRSYPFQELSFSGTTLFRMNPFQELSLSGIFPLIAAQKKHNLVAIIEAQKKEKQSEGCFLNRTFTSLESNCTKKIVQSDRLQNS